MSDPRIGLIGIIGDELQKDYWGALRRVAEMGCQGLEAGMGSISKADLPLAEYRKRLNDTGLEVVAFHATKLTLAENSDQIMQTAAAVGSGILVLSFGPVESEEQLLQDAELYNEIGRKCRGNGLQLTYHNHDHEFERINGKYAFDILLENTEPELLEAHIDVAWVTFGGADPAELIGKYSGRCPVIHAKDFVGLEDGCENAKGDRKQARFTEIGTGIVDLPGIVEAARAAEVEWIVVEQDRPRDLAPMESVRESISNIRSALGRAQ